MTFLDMKSPVGVLRLTAEAGALTGVCLAASTVPCRAGKTEPADTLLLTRAAEELQEYFAGRRRAFDLPLSPKGTMFERAVWDELCRVPFGTSLTYAALAARVGRPRAARAVGNAVGKNPLLILIPCHRVVGVTNPLGFSSGAKVKQFLLRLENICFERKAET